MTFVFDWNLPKTHGMLTIWSTRLIMNEWWYCSLRGLSYNGAGCNYRNKYEIASYGSESSDSVRVQVRHYQDSYIAAEEATKGCSSENINEKNCISNSISSENVSMSVKASSYATSDQVRVTSNQRTAVILVCISLTATVNIIIAKIWGYILFFCHCLKWISISLFLDICLWHLTHCI